MQKHKNVLNFILKKQLFVIANITQESWNFFKQRLRSSFHMKNQRYTKLFVKVKIFYGRAGEVVYFGVTQKQQFLFVILFTITN